MKIFEINNGSSSIEPVDGRIKLKRYLAQTQNKSRPAHSLNKIQKRDRTHQDSGVSGMDVTPNFNLNGRRKEDLNQGRVMTVGTTHRHQDADHDLQADIEQQELNQRMLCTGRETNTMTELEKAVERKMSSVSSRRSTTKKLHQKAKKRGGQSKRSLKQ